MTDPTEVVFLGANNVGREVYDWLCDRESVAVRAMLTEADQLSLVADLEPEVVVAVGFQHIVPPEILAVPEKGCLNLHPGLLPETRGFNPNVWSIVEGHPAGATLHYMDDGVDTGDVIARERVEKRFDDTGRDLYERLERACFEVFTEAWPDVESGTVETEPQDDDRATTHRKREFTDLCELDADAEYTVKELLDRLRALTFPPFDNARIEVDGETYFVDVDVRHEDDADEDAEFGSLSSY
ncbi:methionyl-tRNA formyltransferase [Halorussus caseinilyticus]|uniref:phosphoribosylglycinamide formyltransferase 1 n=1 Tax=Halorussus caseinilyticus TaxID=3034025 RepID=A0ABD5WIR3_9EURY|nr:formyltransferase family protein [Halorussus sp. DT72]